MSFWRAAAVFTRDPEVATEVAPDLPGMGEKWRSEIKCLARLVGPVFVGVHLGQCWGMKMRRSFLGVDFSN